MSEIKPSMHVKDMVLFEDVLVNAEALACARLYGPDTTPAKTRGQITRKWNRLCFDLGGAK